MVVDCHVATKERTQLAQELEIFKGETSRVVKAEKRSIIGDGGRVTYISFGDHNKSIKYVENKLDKKHKECVGLQVSKNKYKDRVKELESQLKIKNSKLGEDIDQRQVIEIQLKGSNIHVSLVKEESSRLKS